MNATTMRILAAAALSLGLDMGAARAATDSKSGSDANALVMSHI